MQGSRALQACIPCIACACARVTSMSGQDEPKPSIAQKASATARGEQATPRPKQGDSGAPSRLGASQTTACECFGEEGGGVHAGFNPVQADAP